MGVISIGASLGVAERNAVRVPSVSPSVVAASASTNVNANQLGASPATTNSHHHVRRLHEYNYNNQYPQATGGGRPRRHRQRKFGQTQGPSTSMNTGTSTSFPPPPIVTSTTASATVTTSSSATKTQHARSIKTPSIDAVGPPLSQVVRIVTFETNVEAQILQPMVLGANNGTRLQAFMTQSKCTIAFKPSSNGTCTDEVVIQLGSGTSPTASTVRRISFTLTADTTKQIDHAMRLLQGAIENAEQIVLRKQSATQTSSAAVATPVAVDSGGNGKPSSGHVSVSRAATPDHSIDDPPPPSRQVTPLLSSSSTAHGYAHEMSRDSVDERKAQTRIRYPPTNQPPTRGPGFASSRSITESTASMMVSVPVATPHPIDKAPTKKRQLPTSTEEEAHGESNKRERTSFPHDAISCATRRQMDLTSATQELFSNAQPDGGDVDGVEDPEFDEFRIRLTRGIEFARQVDAQAARVKQRMLREKSRYLRMIQQVQNMKHQQRVADVVIRTQCAIMATTESSGRKRRRIEQLSVAQDVVQNAIAADKKILSSRLPAGIRTRLDSKRLSSSSASPELADLMRKLAAFRAVVSNKAMDPSSKEEPVQASLAEKNGRSSGEMPRNITSSVSPQQQVTEPSKCLLPGSEIDNQNDTFRPRHLAPGIQRDMNLIQDYTSESDCAVLRLLIGQRQYFYLEPISLSFGISDLERLDTEGVRTINDLEVMREFIIKRRHFGGDLVKSIETVSSNTLQSLASSTDGSWTSMQRSLLEMHPVLLVLHLLAYHYHAVAILEKKGIPVSRSKSDLLSNEEELSSDLFKFVLRPIRSSAIESSLNDALPISLVRETIAHCPEVVNHVLDWKDESDVPPALLHDVTSTQLKKDKSLGASNSGSTILSETLRHLQRCASDFDRGLNEMARHFQGLRSGTVSGDKIVHLVNQLKSLGASLVVANTQLQLHKWATVFVANGFSWCDEGIEDELDDSNGLNGDRSYDKFTCLQDALFVWHNAKLSYSAKDEDCKGMEVGSSPGMSSHVQMEPESEEAINPDDEEKEDSELAHLRRVTPPEVMNVVETNFTDAETILKFMLTSETITLTRKEFNDSLATMRASMKVLGRTAPWRTHVKHSNILKVEYRKQRELENKLLLHQWATHFKDRPLPYLRQNPSDCTAGDSSDTNHLEDENVGVDCLRADEEPKDTNDEAPSNPPDINTETGIVLEPGDTPEVVDMKLLRHEIESVAKKMSAMGGTDDGDTDRKKLLDACSLLAASCVSALTKFLCHDEPPVSAEVTRSGSTSARGSRQRATSARKVGKNGVGEKAVHAESSRKHRPRARAPSVDVTSSTARGDDDHTGTPDAVLPHATKKGNRGSSAHSGRRSRAHSTSSASPRAPPAVSPIQSIPSISTRVGSSKAAVTQVSAVTATSAEPLRMGCSGCRDTRRRCTGCHGCCLHCVCLGCGCRMCCSSRNASVQKTLNLLVTAVETRMGCKWIELDSVSDRSERCGMVKVCSMCQQCVSHCKCHPSTQASRCDTASSSQAGAIGIGGSSSATAGFPSAAARKERRFRINPTAAQRRQNQTSGCSDDETRATSTRRAMPQSGTSGPTVAKRTRRSNSDATPSMFKDDSVDSTTGSDFMSSEFSGSSTDGIPFVSTNPPAHHKNEQEDLFRAARVRMKLQRNAFMKASNPYGMIPPNTLIEGEMLWHPERIRLMWERKDVYGVLGVPREATPQLIKKQYRKLVLKLHPDKVQGPNESADMTSQNPGEACSLDDRVSAFVAVTQAYKLLSGDIGAIHNNGWKTSP